MLFSIALGGAVGTLARFWLGGLAQRVSAGFPFGTLAINIVGSFLLGFLMRYLLGTTASPELRASLTIGFCGGFTTFSTFSYETAMLIESGSYARAVAYVVASVIVALLATVCGFWAARALTAPAH
ncbi:MAG: fluoride efflux transporter CrcB [Gemmatimonadaceae bacterium]|nr:fluoride efflux transporter CrcB [Gemmatimonadaceae bacterium]